MSIRDWAGTLITTERDILNTLVQLAKFNVAIVQSATVTLGDKNVTPGKDMGDHVVTVTCRRFIREEKERKAHNLRQQRYRQKREGDATVTEKRRNDDGEIQPLPSSPSSSSPKSPSSTKPPNPEKTQDQEKSSAQPSAVAAKGISIPVWDAYEAAYRRRWNAEPVRNASVNAMLAKLVGFVGAEEAPKLAAFYVSHNRAQYIEARHPVNLLLRDYSGLMTQMRTGQKATRGEAKQAEVRDDAVSQIQRVSAMLPERPS